jgi:lipid-binding SYLF domain-containing protein
LCTSDSRTPPTPIINTYEALDAFKKFRCTLGGEVSATAGPVGVGGVV